jgi:hypothetical protein
VFVCPLRGLKGIDFLSALYDGAFGVRRGRAFSGSPFAGWVGVNLAIPAGGNIKYLAAITAQLQNSVTASPIESTTFLGHEAAILSVFDGLTNHGKLLLLFIIIAPRISNPDERDK